VGHHALARQALGNALVGRNGRGHITSKFESQTTTVIDVYVNVNPKIQRHARTESRSFAIFGGFDQEVAGFFFMGFDLVQGRFQVGQL
jgi:hypothetical protein